MRLKRTLTYLMGATLITLTIAGCFLAPRDYYEITFLDDPCIRPHASYHYLTCHPITVKVNDQYFIIPKDFDTDLASIPKWYWSFLSPAYSAFIAPSILHDYLYSCSSGMSRQQIDEIFYYALVQNGVSVYTAYKMYIAVRAFGAEHFNARACVDKVLHIDNTDFTENMFTNDD